MAGVSLQTIVESNFRELKETFVRVEEEIAAVKAQTIKTNGRVTRLENWRYMLTGAWVVLTVVVVPITLYVIDLYFKK